MKKAISVLLTVLLLLGLSVPAFAASVYESYRIPAGSVRMIAHMGYSAIAPANTLPSYIAAGESNFWGAECDIQRTADGVWILMHNDTVDAMTDGTGPVMEKTYAEMMELNVNVGNNIDQYPGLKVATLEQYLDVCKEYGLHPVIEIKESADPEYMDEVAAILSAREEKDMFYVISFGREICVRMKTLMPALRVYYIISYEDVSRENIDFALESGLDGMDIHVFHPEDYVKDVVNSELDVFVWTIDDLDNAERLYNLGVNAITTNSLTQEKPDGNIFQKIIWFFRDFFYKIKMSFKTSIEKIKS